MVYGVDINSNWELDESGDLVLVSDIKNMEQAVFNRLTNELNSMGDFYENYGSLLYQFLGWRKTDSTLEFIKLEITNRLKQDKRILDCNVEADYTNAETVRLGNNIVLDGEYVHNIELELSDNGVDLVGNR